MFSYAVRYDHKESLHFRLPQEIVVQEMKSSVPPYSADNYAVLKKIIRDSLLKSFGHSLKESIDIRKPIVIVVDDHTRETPAFMVLENLYDLLHKIGIIDKQIFILIANGTHRKMSKEELNKKLGDFLSIFTIKQHNCEEKDDLFLAGEIDGIPIFLNRILKESGTVIGIGSIIAHRFSGWSGGSKIICPGICGYKTIFLSHKRAILEEKISLGIEDNWFRSFIDRVGELANLSFIIDFVPGINGFFGVVSGEPHMAFRKGVEIAEHNVIVHFQNRSDIVVVSSYPATIDLWQSGKAFYVGDLLAKDGGMIIAVSPLKEGLGDHPGFITALKMYSYEIKSHLIEGVKADPLAVVSAYAVRKIADRCKVRVISLNPTFQNKSISSCIEISEDLQNLIDRSITKQTKNIGIVQDLYVLPLPIKN